MKIQDVDVAVIGAGTAGLSAYREARQNNARAVLIEGGPYGTTCARVGCMPSKLLIAAAEAAEGIRRAPGFGVHAESLQIDGKAVMARVRSERDRFVGFVLEGVDSIPETDCIRGWARFVNPTQLQIGEDLQLHARSVVIATGSRPFVPPLLADAGLGERLILNDDLFNWQDLPESVAVFGAGVIGLELGQALHQLGVRTHLFGVRGAVGALSDPVVKAEAAAIFRAEFPFQTDARVQSVTATGSGADITYLDANDQAVTEHFDYVLAATGRWPNLDRLGLQALGLELDRFGLPPFDKNTLQVADLPIFLAGDVNNHLPLLHEASDEGRAAGRNASRYPHLNALERRAPISIVFSHPQLAMVGQTFASLDKDCTAIGSVSFSNQGRSRVMLQNHGQLRIYADYRTRRFLGAEMVGPRAEHLAHLLAWAYQQQLSIDHMLEMPFYHPVIEEGLRTALQNTVKVLNEGPPADCDCPMSDPSSWTA
ncbi:MAG: dihydrolipoyl dehydrogenase [Candidatus Sericytochromatia bacterium]|nr:dihydrolipoyl dehydrogenase [Candidatus Sericytochromatia bacterium]